LTTSTAASTSAEFNGELTITSRYLHRGLNFSGDNPALQGLVEYSSSVGLYAGIWASTVEVPWDERQVEIDYFAGYQHRFNPRIAIDATVIRYTYEGPDVDSMYNWTEGQLTAHLLDHWSITVSQADNWAGRGASTATAEATYRYALRPHWMMDGTVGHAEVVNAVGFNYQWGELGLARAFGPVNARLAYSATNGAGTFGDLARNRWLFSIAWRPR
jgi:uncharacterized protein (TIGR02001 family)